jgi:serine protease
VIESRLGENVQHAAARSGLRVDGGKHDARDTCEHQRSRAHRAGLERDVDDRVEHPPAARRRRGLAQREHLRVSGRILTQLSLVVSSGNHLTIAHDNRPDRHVLVVGRAFRLAYREAHEVVVAWEEALAHVSRPRSLRQCVPPAGLRRIIITETLMPSRARRLFLRPTVHRTLTAAASCTALLAIFAPAVYASGPSYTPGQILVKYAPATPRRARTASAHAAGAFEPAVTLAPHTRLLRLARGVSVSAALTRLRARRNVVWAVPDYRAHASGSLIPNDVGEGGAPGDWQQLQWNFAGPFGVDAPEAWSNVAADGAPGGKGVVVAVLDTGVAYANRAPFLRSPDLSRYGFVGGYDFIAHNRFPNDRNGHGTFVAGTIAEATNNHFGVTGLAFAAHIMPVRVLDSQGEGEASTIAEGVRFAVKHGAQVINLSLEFSSNVTASDIPELLEALRYARRRGVLVVAAAGNEAHSTVAYPARAPDVVAVGATTEHGCLADYSNDGSGLTLVAPGGGADANLPGDPNCHPELPAGRDVFQVTFTGSSPRRFGLPSGYEGTSMASPHVAATAALIIASGVIGRHPTPAAIIARLRATARKLGGGGDEHLYGAGLVDAAAATAPGGPGALAR